MPADTVILDLDGTIANVDHRIHLVKTEHPDWDSFYKSCVNDTPNEWAMRLIKAMADYGYLVVIVSARPKLVEAETVEWLTKYVPAGVQFMLCMLRESWDHSPDVELKKAWLDKFDKSRILFVVDDRGRVCDLWRKEGLVCLQCASWEEYKRPKKVDDTPEVPVALHHIPGPGIS